MAVLTFLLFLVSGAALAAGGVWLVSLGGSWSYALVGIGFLATSALVLWRQPIARLLYALLVLATLFWALWEVGMDWWPLATRGGIVVLLGLWLLLPWTARRDAAARTSWLALAGSVLVTFVVAGLALNRTPHDV